MFIMNSRSVNFVLQDKIVAPHLKHEFNAICNLKQDPARKAEIGSKFSQFLRWIFRWGNDDTQSHGGEL